MTKIKSITAMKQRLQQALSDLAEQEAVIELVRQAVIKYDLQPADVFSAEALGSALATSVDESIPYCDRSGNTWLGKGCRPRWLIDAIESGAELDDFKNPSYAG